MENWHNTTKNRKNSDRNSSLVTMNLMNHTGRNGEHCCVPFNFKNSSRGLLMWGSNPQVDWGGNLKLYNTSSGCVLKGDDWGGKLIDNSMVHCGTHETHPNGHNIPDLDWGGHGSSFNHMTVFLLSDVDLELITHVSSFSW